MTDPNLASWLPGLLGPFTLQADSTAVARRATINLVGAGATDVPAENRVDVDPTYAIMNGENVAWGDDTGAQILTRRCSGSTVTGSTTTLFAETLPDNAVTAIDVLVIARDATPAANGARFNLSFAYQRHAAGAPAAFGTLVSTSSGSSAGSPPSGYAAIIDVSGNDVRVRVTGPTAPVNWIAIVQLIPTIAA